MKKSLLTLFLGIAFLPLFSQSVIYSGTLINSDPTFTRPNDGVPPTTLSTYTHVHYHIIPIAILTPGLLDINSNSTWDNFLILYSPAGFNPATPLTNALVANDDLGVSSSAGFTYNFTTVGTYYLVVSSFKNSVTGNYAITTSPTSVVPVKLNSFTAAKSTTNSILVKWSSASESNLNFYQVQRSADGNNFTDLSNGSIAAKNSGTLTGYSYTDNSPATGINYYRLKILEKTGQISYGSIVLVKNTTKSGMSLIKIFPNPVADFLQIEANSLQSSKAIVSVINASGTTVQSGQYRFNSQAILSVDIKQLPAGNYFLKTIIDNQESTATFIKK